jgi:hypothetical protein
MSAEQNMSTVTDKRTDSQHYCCACGDIANVKRKKVCSQTSLLLKYGNLSIEPDNGSVLCRNCYRKLQHIDKSICDFRELCQRTQHSGVRKRSLNTSAAVDDSSSTVSNTQSTPVNTCRPILPKPPQEGSDIPLSPIANVSKKPRRELNLNCVPDLSDHSSYLKSVTLTSTPKSKPKSTSASSSATSLPHVSSHDHCYTTGSQVGKSVFTAMTKTVTDMFQGHKADRRGIKLTINTRGNN